MFKKTEIVDSKLLLFLVVCLATIICIIWRYNQFSSIGPFTDHAFYMQWIKRMVYADHFFPLQEMNKNWLQTLMVDSNSFCNIFFRQIYSSHPLIFTSISTLLFVIFSELIGASIQNQILISIIIATLSISILSSFPFIAFREQKERDFLFKSFLCTILTFLLLSLSSFLNIFSALGVHNFGIFFLIISSLINIYWLKVGSFQAPKKITTLMIVGQVFAIYSHYTNVFLIPTSTFISILISLEKPISWRLKTSFNYFFITILLFLPILVILAFFFFGPVKVPFGNTFSAVASEVMISPTEIFLKITERIYFWFSFHSSVFSILGLSGSLLGLIHLAFRHDVLLPITITFCHFLSSVIIPAFYLQKTGAYILPFLCLGLSWLLTLILYELKKEFFPKKSLKLRSIIQIIALITVLLFHLSKEIPRLINPEKTIWAQVLYIRSIWDPIVDVINKLLVNQEQFLGWNYPITNTVFSLIDQKKKTITWQRPLSTLDAEHKKKRLKEYITTRGLKWTQHQDSYLLVPGSIKYYVLKKILHNILGPNGFNLRQPFKVIRIKDWHHPKHTQSFHLYMISTK